MEKKLVKKTVITEEFVVVAERKAKAAGSTDEDMLESLGDLADIDDEDCDEEDDVEPSASPRSRGRRSR